MIDLKKVRDDIEGYKKICEYKNKKIEKIIKEKIIKNNKINYKINNRINNKKLIKKVYKSIKN